MKAKQEQPHVDNDKEFLFTHLFTYKANFHQDSHTHLKLSRPPEWNSKILSTTRYFLVLLSYYMYLIKKGSRWLLKRCWFHKHQLWLEWKPKIIVFREVPIARQLHAVTWPLTASTFPKTKDSNQTNKLLQSQIKGKIQWLLDPNLCNNASVFPRKRG